MVAHLKFQFIESDFEISVISRLSLSWGEHESKKSKKENFKFLASFCYFRICSDRQFAIFPHQYESFYECWAMISD